MFTRSRSTCTASPRTGWRCRSLTSTGVPVAAVDRDLEDRAGVRERVAQDAGVDREVLGVAVAAVDHAGDEALAAQAARGARAFGSAGGEGERSGVEGMVRRRRGAGRVREGGARAARHASESGSAGPPEPGTSSAMSPDEELMLIFGALHLVALAFGVLLFVLFLRSDRQRRPRRAGGGRGRRRRRQRPHLRTGRKTRPPAASRCPTPSRRPCACAATSAWPTCGPRPGAPAGRRAGPHAAGSRSASRRRLRCRSGASERSRCRSAQAGLRVTSS